MIGSPPCNRAAAPVVNTALWPESALGQKVTFGRS